METLFGEFLSMTGVTVEDVTTHYYNEFTSKQFHMTWNFFISSLLNIKKFWRFIRSPLIWSPKKLSALGVNKKLMSVLSSTTVVLTMG
jgi:hypothetical protein